MSGLSCFFPCTICVVTGQPCDGQCRTGSAMTVSVITVSVVLFRVKFLSGSYIQHVFIHVVFVLLYQAFFFPLSLSYFTDYKRLILVQHGSTSGPDVHIACKRCYHIVSFICHSSNCSFNYEDSLVHLCLDCLDFSLHDLCRDQSAL